MTEEMLNLKEQKWIKNGIIIKQVDACNLNPDMMLSNVMGYSHTSEKVFPNLASIMFLYHGCFSILTMPNPNMPQNDQNWHI
jgi:hypothetical protein